MFEYASDLEKGQNSNRLVTLKFLTEIFSLTCFFSEMAHFFKLENPEIAHKTKHSILRIHFLFEF